MPGDIQYICCPSGDSGDSGLVHLNISFLLYSKVTAPISSLIITRLLHIILLLLDSHHVEEKI